LTIGKVTWGEQWLLCWVCDHCFISLFKTRCIILESYVPSLIVQHSSGC